MPLQLVVMGVVSALGGGCDSGTSPGAAMEAGTGKTDGTLCECPPPDCRAVDDDGGSADSSDAAGGGSGGDASAGSGPDELPCMSPDMRDPTAEDPDDAPDTLPDELGATSSLVDGVRYGAEADDRGPIGGGTGYEPTIRPGDADHVVGTVQQLVDALGEASRDEIVYVRNDAQLDLTVRVVVEDFRLVVPEGVTLASGRGVDGAAGGLIFSDHLATRPLIEVGGPDVRITGLRIRGPDTRIRDEELARALREHGRSGYYGFPQSRGIFVSHEGFRLDNSELSGWGESAVHLDEIVCEPDEAADCAHIHHNHIHHNHRRGLGYGVVHYTGSSLIEYNLFDYNRHSIAGSGAPGEGYEARHNVVLTHANVYGHAFDMHGGRDRGDGTEIAGTWLRIHHNQFRLTHEEAVRVRGVPERFADIHHNWFFHATPGGDVIDSGGSTTVEDNVYECPPTEKEEDPGYESS